MSRAADEGERPAVVMSRRVGIFGGTFDPPHDGHVAAAHGVADALDLDLVLWVPARRSPHKPDAALSAAGVRARMVRAVTDEHPRFAMTTLEVDREGPSYTVDTLRTLSADPDLADATLFLIIGVDQYRAFDRWRAPTEILDLATLVVMDREGEGMSPAESVVCDERPDRVVRVRVPRVDVSSTEVRARTSRRENLRGKVPDSVAALIASEGLYEGR